MSGISSVAGNIAATVSRAPGADQAVFAAALGEAVPAATTELTNLLTARSGVTHAIDALQGVRIRSAHPIRSAMSMRGAGLTPTSARELGNAVHQAQLGVAVAKTAWRGTLDSLGQLPELAKRTLEASRTDAPNSAVFNLRNTHRSALEALHTAADDLDLRLGELSVQADAAKVNALVDGIKQSLLGIGQ